LFHLQDLPGRYEHFRRVQIFVECLDESGAVRVRYGKFTEIVVAALVDELYLFFLVVKKIEES
jgi:hypothetical protein